MLLYCSDPRISDTLPPISSRAAKVRASALASALLARAYFDFCGGELPAIEKTPLGKPFFPDEPQIYFSISHSKSCVLCAISNSPIGVDTQQHRSISPATVKRLTTPRELTDLSFFEIWVLRESFFKLTGRGSLRNLPFYKQDGEIILPENDIYCHLYNDIENSSTAAISTANDFPEHLTKIPANLLLEQL
ncbi:MAG: hypothetical protein RSC52_02165 [Oscillospiraceae bacterium]